MRLLYTINMVGHSTGSFCIRKLGRRTYIGPHIIRSSLHASLYGMVVFEEFGEVVGYRSAFVCVCPRVCANVVPRVRLSFVAGFHFVKIAMQP